MSTNLGNITAILTLDVKPFSEGIKTMQKLAQMGAKNVNDIFKMKAPTFSMDKLDAEIKKLDNTLDKYQSELKQTEIEQKKVTASTNQVAAASSGFSGKLLNFTLVLGYVRQGLNYAQRGFDFLTDSFNRQEVAGAKLMNGLKNVGEGIEAYNRLTKQASDLQLTTPFADEQTMNAQAMLTTFKKSSEEIEILTPRVLDLAAAFMQNGESQMDVQQVAVMLGKVNEETIGTLRRVGVAFSQEQEEKLKSLKGTQQAIYLSKILDQNFKGMAETVGNTFAGKVTIMKNRLGEVFERIGGFLAGAGSKFLNFFSDLLPVIESAAAKILAFYKEVLNLISAAMGGQKAADDFKKSLIDLVRNGVDFLLAKARETIPYILDLVNSFRNFIAQNPALIDQLGKIGKAMYEIAFWIFKIEVAILSKVVDVSSFLLTQVKNAIKLIQDFANSPAGKILFYGSPITALFDAFSGSGENPVTTQPVTDQPYVDHPPAPPKKNPVTTSPKTNTGNGKSSTESEADKESKALDELLTKVKEDIQNRIYKNTLTQEFLQSQLDILDMSKLNLKTVEQENKVFAVRKDIFKQIFDMTKMILGQPKVIIDIDLSEEMKKHLEWFKKYLEELEEKAQKEAERISKMYSEINSVLSSSISIADTLASKLTGGAKSFLNYISMALKVAQQAIGLAQKGSSEDGLSFGDIFGAVAGIFGTILGFSSGTSSVPGFGNEDTVPAMLTPGEAVIKKSRVSQLVSQYGWGFINWLNGGGLTPALAGHYNSGGVVSAALSSSGMGIYLNGKVLDGKTKQRIYKDGFYLESMSIGRKEIN